MIRPFVQKSGNRVQKTAMRQMIADMRYLAELIVGDDISDVDLVGLRGHVANTVDPGESGEQGTLNYASSVLQAALNLNGESSLSTEETPDASLNYLYTEDKRFVGLSRIVSDLVTEFMTLNGDLIDLESIYDTGRGD